ncbi:MAG: hypothetical protein ACJ74W_03245 [Pyrinomonadaceae bacterium]
MPTIYVAGPVLRPHDSSSDLANIYQQIYATLGRAGYKVILPIQDDNLERADPQTFYRVMEQRIASSDFVVTVFPDLNRSAPVEATMASFMHKRQYVLAGEERNVPRLIQGLPGVRSVAPMYALDDVLSRLQQEAGMSDVFDVNRGNDESGGGPLIMS